MEIQSNNQTQREEVGCLLPLGSILMRQCHTAANYSHSQTDAFGLRQPPTVDSTPNPRVAIPFHEHTYIISLWQKSIQEMHSTTSQAHQLWLGQLKAFTGWSWSCSFVILAMCSGLLFCWKVNLHPFWGPEQFVAGYHQGCLCTLL